MIITQQPGQTEPEHRQRECLPTTTDIMAAVARGEYQLARVMLAELEQADPLVRTNIPIMDFY